MKPTPVYHALPRAVVHAAVGLVIVVCFYFLPRLIALVLLAVGTAGVVTLDLVRLQLPVLGERLYTFFEPVLRGGEASRPTGASYYLIGSLVSLLLFPRDIAFLAILFLALGDSAAAVFGSWKGRIRYRGKSLEGDVACLVICLAIAFLVPRVLEGPGIAVAITGAVVAALFQALPLPVNDNLTIPIGSGLSMIIVGVMI
jgi:dolichol kinase